MFADGGQTSGFAGLRGSPGSPTGCRTGRNGGLTAALAPQRPGRSRNLWSADSAPPGGTCRLREPGASSRGLPVPRRGSRTIRRRATGPTGGIPSGRPGRRPPHRTRRSIRRRTANGTPESRVWNFLPQARTDGWPRLFPADGNPGADRGLRSVSAGKRAPFAVPLRVRHRRSVLQTRSDRAWTAPASALLIAFSGPSG